MQSVRLFLSALLAVPATTALDYHHVDLWSNSAVAQGHPDFDLFFKVDGDQAHFKARVGIRGDRWFSVGQSTSGGMKGADVAIFLPNLADNTYTLGDYWSDDFSTPTLDEQQNLELHSVNIDSELGEVTVEWSRPLLSCDQDQDLDMHDAEARVIFAVGRGPQLTYHEFRSNSNINWFRGDVSAEKEAAIEKDAIIVDIRPDVPFEVLQQRTTYKCIFVPLPKLDVDHHLVKSEPIIDTKFAHHMLYFMCPTLVKEMNGHTVEMGKGFDCDSMPPPGCSGAGSWAVGATTNYYPDGVGLRFPKGTQFVMIQYHFDNPNFESGGADRSGVKFSLTPSLRPNDLATMVMTNPWQSLSLPPGRKAYDLTVDFPPSCSKRMSNEAVIESVGFHMHQRGTYTYLEHWRDGKRLPDILGQAWDFNFQGSVPIPHKPILKPGDHLRLHCIFNTEDATEPVLGGDGTNDEMCIALVNVWPPIDVQASLRLDALTSRFAPAGGDRQAMVCAAGNGERHGFASGFDGGDKSQAQVIQQLTQSMAYYTPLPESEPWRDASRGRCGLVEEDAITETEEHQELIENDGDDDEQDDDPRGGAEGDHHDDAEGDHQDDAEGDQEDAQPRPDVCVCLAGPGPACMTAATQRCQQFFATPYCQACMMDGPASASCASSMQAFLAEICQQGKLGAAAASTAADGSGGADKARVHVRYLTVTRVHRRRAELLWAGPAPASTGCSTHAYRVELAKANGDDGRTGPFSAVLSAAGEEVHTDTHATLSGLAPHTRYVARVSVVDEEGQVVRGSGRTARLRTRKGKRSRG